MEERADAADADAADVVEAAEAVASPNAIACGFSGGKDSLAVLDICHQRFPAVFAFFLYFVKGLSFQESTLQWAEKRYGIEIYRLPHYNLHEVMSLQRLNFVDPERPDLPPMNLKKVEDHVRRKFGVEWIASGAKPADSLIRRMTIKSQWDEKNKKHYPLFGWGDRQVAAYLRQQHIPIPSEYQFMPPSRDGKPASWHGLQGDHLQAVYEHFPEDYRRILEVFQFADAIRVRWLKYGAKPTPKVHHRKKKQSEPEAGAVQPSQDHGPVESKAAV